MKVYSIYGGKIFSLEVRETAEMYIVIKQEQTPAQSLAFGCRGRFYKNEYGKSPIEAIEKQMESEKQNRRSLVRKILGVNTRIKELEKLKGEL
jgi:hypothetical protein